jgi:hypothetical protein
LSSPTQRSLKKLKDEGYVAEVVEKRIPHTKITKDLYGFIDILAVGHGETLAVQTTTGSHVANRLTKINSSANLQPVKAAGWRVIVHGWAKRGARGKPKLWTCREVEV